MHAAGGTFRAFLRMEDIVTSTSFWADRVEWPGVAAVPPLSAIAALAGAIDLQIGRRSLRHGSRNRRMR